MKTDGKKTILNISPMGPSSALNVAIYNDFQRDFKQYIRFMVHLHEFFNNSICFGFKRTSFPSLSDWCAFNRAKTHTHTRSETTNTILSNLLMQIKFPISKSLELNVSPASSQSTCQLTHMCDRSFVSFSFFVCVRVCCFVCLFVCRCSMGACIIARPSVYWRQNRPARIKLQRLVLLFFFTHIYIIPTHWIVYEPTCTAHICVYDVHCTYILSIWMGARHTRSICCCFYL